LGSSSASGPQQGSGPRRGTNIRAGGDREFCCFLWDIEAQQSANKRNALPVSKLSHNAPVASLAWVLDGQTLAVGSQSRNIQLYDMRVSTNNVPPISAHAHSFGVHGIEVDPNKPVGCVRFQCQL
jgi:WD40 repeat protein